MSIAGKGMISSSNEWWQKHWDQGLQWSFILILWWLFDHSLRTHKPRGWTAKTQRTFIAARFCQISTAYLAHLVMQNWVVPYVLSPLVSRLRKAFRMQFIVIIDLDPPMTFWSQFEDTQAKRTNSQDPDYIHCSKLLSNQELLMLTIMLMQKWVVPTKLLVSRLIKACNPQKTKFCIHWCTPYCLWKMRANVPPPMTANVTLCPWELMCHHAHESSCKSIESYSKKQKEWGTSIGSGKLCGGKLLSIRCFDIPFIKLGRSMRPRVLSLEAICSRNASLWSRLLLCSSKALICMFRLPSLP